MASDPDVLIRVQQKRGPSIKKVYRKLVAGGKEALVCKLVNFAKRCVVQCPEIDFLHEASGRLQGISIAPLDHDVEHLVHLVRGEHNQLVFDDLPGEPALHPLEVLQNTQRLPRLVLERLRERDEMNRESVRSHSPAVLPARIPTCM